MKLFLVSCLLLVLFLCSCQFFQPSRTDAAQALADLRDAGVITREQFDALYKVLVYGAGDFLRDVAAAGVGLVVGGGGMAVRKKLGGLLLGQPVVK